MPHATPAQLLNASRRTRQERGASTYVSDLLLDAARGLEQVERWLDSARTITAYHLSMEEQEPEVRTPSGWVGLSELLNSLEQALPRPGRTDQETT